MMNKPVVAGGLAVATVADRNSSRHWRKIWPSRMPPSSIAKPPRNTFAWLFRLLSLRVRSRSAGGCSHTDCASPARRDASRRGAMRHDHARVALTKRARHDGPFRRGACRCQPQGVLLFKLAITLGSSRRHCTGCAGHCAMSDGSCSSSRAGGRRYYSMAAPHTSPHRGRPD